MKKSILAASLSAALCLLTSHSVMARDISIDFSKTDEAPDDKVGETAYTASGKDTFKGKGANSDIDYTLTGRWSGLFFAEGSANSWDISNFNNLTMEFTNPSAEGGKTGYTQVVKLQFSCMI